MKKQGIFLSLILLLTLTLFSSCTSKDNDLEPKGSNDDQVSFTFFEDAMIGKFSRYHAYDGSTRYFIFHDDRTACYWEQIGSSRSDKDTYAYWELIDEGDNIFSVMVKSSPSGTLYTIGKFKYAQDLILKGGYSNLKYTRSNTTKECE